MLGHQAPRHVEAVVGRTHLVGRLCDLDRIASCVLGSVHRLIGGVNQLSYVGAVIRIPGNPDREGDRTQDRALVHDGEPVSGLANLLRPEDAHVERALGEQDDELVSTVAARYVFNSDNGMEQAT